MKTGGVACTDLVKSFGDPPVDVIRSITLNIKRGDFVAITGRSGSGKSTLLYLLSGLDVPGAGHVTVDGESLEALSPEAFDSFRNERLGFVFQFHHLLPELTALENILMPARRSGLHLEKKANAEALLEQFELSHCRDKVPGKMSGGEQQRAAIARALIMEPDFLFADEPTGNLDTSNGETVMNIFEHVNRSLGTTMLMVTHEPDYAARARRQIQLVDGVVFEDSDAYSTPAPRSEVAEVTGEQHRITERGVGSVFQF